MSYHCCQFKGIGPAEELEHLKIPLLADLKVGYNLRDQIAFQGLNFIYNTTHDPVYHSHSHNDYVSYLKDGSGPLAATGLELVAFLKTAKSKDKSKYPDVELLLKRENYIPGTFVIFNIHVQHKLI